MSRNLTHPTYGTLLLESLERVGALGSFAGEFFRRFWRRPFEGRELFNQMDEAGTKSLVLVLVTGLSIGVVLSMQSRGTLARFGAEAVLMTHAARPWGECPRARLSKLSAGSVGYQSPARESG